MSSTAPESATGRTVVVLGTAGHVDHGKSSLVRALSGTDPDRLAEEKARGLTIDLGFATQPLPSGLIASFVDVPGHEDFIRNALAGAGGVDAAILVVAADEGPMPQTLEHLAILDLLGVRHAVAAVTKADLVEEDWLELVVEEVAELLAPTTLAGAPVIPVSSTTGAGLDALVETLDEVLAGVPEPRDVARPRLSVDRVFTLAGFGTVVTGTLRDGRLHPGDALTITPSGTEARVRGLHSHGIAVDEALPGTRTAVNLAGVDVEQMARGDVLHRPGDYAPTRLVDLEVEVLDDAVTAIEHDRALALFHGASEIQTRVRLIATERLERGERGWLQLHLAQPTVLAAGDRVVLRLPSPSKTIGGGVVLDPRAPRFWRRFEPAVETRFAALAGADEAERLWHLLRLREPCRAAAIAPPDSGLEPAERDVGLAALAARDRALALGEPAEPGDPADTPPSAASWWVTDEGWRALSESARSLLEAYHARFPLRVGPPPEELRERLDLAPEAYAAALTQATAEGWLDREGGRPRLASHSVRFDAEAEAASGALLARFRAAPFSPPSAADARAAVGHDVLEALLARGDLISVNPDVLFDREGFETLRDWVVEHVGATGQVTVADLRDRFDTSRKYALGFLEHLDRIHLTRRVGDARVLAREGGG